jgi:hypothetical protein
MAQNLFAGRIVSYTTFLQMSNLKLSVLSLTTATRNGVEALQIEKTYGTIEAAIKRICPGLYVY